MLTPLCHRTYKCHNQRSLWLLAVNSQPIWISNLYYSTGALTVLMMCKLMYEGASSLGEVMLEEVWTYVHLLLVVYVGMCRVRCTWTSFALVAFKNKTVSFFTIACFFDIIKNTSYRYSIIWIVGLEESAEQTAIFVSRVVGLVSHGLAAGKEARFVNIYGTDLYSGWEFVTIPIHGFFYRFLLFPIARVTYTALFF